MTSDNGSGRREFLRSTALAALVGAAPQEALQHIHEHAVEAKAKSPDGVYRPKTLTQQEFRTVGILADMIVPPENGEAGGSVSGAPAYIDLLCSGADEMAARWQGGLAWLDAQSRREHGAAFGSLDESRRTAVLNRIAYRKNASPELNPGIAFFALARQMVVDAWVTSPQGTQLLGYRGNVGMQTFQVPAEALDYALARSPFKEG